MRPSGDAPKFSGSTISSSIFRGKRLCLSHAYPIMTSVVTTLFRTFAIYTLFMPTLRISSAVNTVTDTTPSSSDIRWTKPCFPLLSP